MVISAVVGFALSLWMGACQLWLHRHFEPDNSLGVGLGGGHCLQGCVLFLRIMLGPTPDEWKLLTGIRDFASPGGEFCSVDSLCLEWSVLRSFCAANCPEPPVEG